MLPTEPAAITGVGWVSALGLDAADSWQALLAGACGARRVDAFAAEGLRHCSAALVDRDGLLRRLAAEPELPAGAADLSWAAVMGLVAARDALRDAGLEAELGAHPLVVSNSIGAPGIVERQGVSWAELDLADPGCLARYSQGAIAAAIARGVGARGEVTCLSTTCAAGNYALAAGLEALRGGAERVLCGGSEEVSTMPYAAFHAIRALADACRPFDAERQGLLFGEGAAFLVLEASGRARARGARVYAELLAVGASNDAHHLVAPHPDGAGATAALRRALEAAGVAPEAVGYVNAHGTGTWLNDRAEARALAAVFGTPPPLSSTKGATGHTMAAASAVEAVITALALHHGLLPSTTGLQRVDPDLGLAPLTGAPRRAAVEVALSSGFGFGGNNAVAVLARPGRAVPAPAERAVHLGPGAALVGSTLGREAVLRRLADGATWGPGERRATADAAALLGAKGLRHVDAGALLLACALETDLGAWPGPVAPERAGAVIGSAVPAYSSVIGIMRDFQGGGGANVNPALVPFATANCAPSWWLLRRRLTGYNGHVATGAAAGLDAIRLAAVQVRRGHADALVAGGVESFTEELWTAWARLGGAGAPLAEAAAAVTLASDPRGAWARLAGDAAAFDASAPEAALRTACAAALARAGLREVEHVVLGGGAVTGLPAARSTALIPMVGDTLGAAGALAALYAAYGVHRGGGPALAAVSSREGYAAAVVLTAPR